MIAGLDLGLKLDLVTVRHNQAVLTVSSVDRSLVKFFSITCQQRPAAGGKDRIQLR